MGLLVAYTAAMQRVLIGLECQALYSVQVDEQEAEQEQQCGGEGEDDEIRREEARIAAFLPLSDALARCCGPSISPATLREMSEEGGEFCGYATTLSYAAEEYCSSVTGDCALLDEVYESETFLKCAQAATQRFETRGVTRAELRQRNKTLEMLILSVAHKIATRMRTKAVRKGG